MKLQIVNNENECIDGFIALKLGEDPKNALSQVINNSCTEIFMLDTLDSLEYNQSLDVLSDVLKKIRLNGSILLRGVSSLAFSHAIFNESIDNKQASDIISNIKSIHDHRDLVTIMELNKLIIDSIRMSGVTYELRATRNSP